MDSEQQHQQPTATFLGLAAEIRIQIYTHLLTPHTSPSDLETLRQTNHCCAYPKGAGRNSDYYSYDIACDCTNRNLFPSILVTSKQIHREASQVLYENMELRVRLPTLAHSINAVPYPCRKYIKRMVIVGSPGELSERHLDLTGDRARWRFPFHRCCDMIASAFPNLQHVRLHIDMGEPMPGRIAIIEQFAMIACLPRLEGD